MIRNDDSQFWKLSTAKHKVNAINTLKLLGEKMMKIASKYSMLVLLALSFLLSLADMAHAMAQITMVNKSQVTLNLYIDGNFGCGPVPGIGHFTNSPGQFCTSNITPGLHSLEARKGQDAVPVAHEEGVNIGDGTSPTWTVNYEEPATVEGGWEAVNSNDRTLIGSRLTILKKADGYYEVRTTNGSNMYSGNATRITDSYQKPLRDVIAEDGTFPPELIQLVGRTKVPLNVSLTLSSDGNILQREADRVGVAYRANPVVYDHYEVFPGYTKTTYKRISGPNY
jgi:hypothetical protein